VTISDPQNVTNEIEVSFLSLEWSPAGRFALLEVTPKSSNVSWQAVLDTLNGKLVQVPDSYELNGLAGNASWLNNGDLIVLHDSDPSNQGPPSFSIYKVIATSNELLVSFKDFPLGEIQSQMGLPTTNASSVFILSWPYLLDSRMLILGSRTTGTASNPALFRIDLEFNKYERILELPQGASDILWSPDGQNALVLGANGQMLFLTLTGGPLRDIRSVLSLQAHDFFWLPPVPRF